MDTASRVVAQMPTSGMGPKAKYSLRADVFCFASNDRHRSTPPPCRFCADSVAKVVLPKMSKILRAAGAVFV